MFSVVIPVWNAAHTLERTLRGVLAQTFVAFEVIVVDDGSTDRSVDVVRRFDDARIRIVTRAHAGPGAARNAGMAAARHEWVAFLDADDLWLPDHLAELDRVRARHPEAGLIGTRCVESDRGGRFRIPNEAAPTIETIRYFDCIARDPFTLSSSSAAVPRRVWASVGGFGEFPTGQDNEYWARIAMRFPVARSTRTTAVYMRGTGGISDRVGTRWLGRELRALSDLSPAVALVMQHYDTTDDARLRQDFDRFIARVVNNCLRASIVARDLPTLRALPRIGRGRLRPFQRLLLAIAALPAPIARAAYLLGTAIRNTLVR
ncbi:MAG TPA: glycosyltransferase [Thermoanaerobaculia bacterium]|nr:glycosyltransferase [Thermoanaerobaculia bacterium]